MFLGPDRGLLVEALDVSLELGSVDAPDPTTTDLYRGQIPRADQRVDLRNAHAEVGRHVLEGEETGLDGARALLVLLGHRATLPPAPSRNVDLDPFAYV